MMSAPFERRTGGTSVVRSAPNQPKSGAFGSWAKGSAIAVGLALMFTQGAQAAITPALSSQMAAAGPSDELSIIIKLPDAVSSKAFNGLSGKASRAAGVKSLKSAARAAQAPLLKALKAAGGQDTRALWLGNVVTTHATPATIEALSNAFPGATISDDPPIHALANGLNMGVADGWNLSGPNGIQADLMWAAGYKGQGVVIGLMDTGLDVHHVALTDSNYNGGANGWCDVTGPGAVSCDGTAAAPTESGAAAGIGAIPGHGSAVAGVLFGGASEGQALGVAPYARWVGVRIFDDNGVGNLSDALTGLDWLANLGTAAPDIINMSWEVGSARVVGQEPDPCATDPNGSSPDQHAALGTTLSTLRNTLGTFLVAASGNSGTPELPAAYLDVFAVGASQVDGTVLTSSGQGGTRCSGRGAANVLNVSPYPASKPYPNVVAPGAQIATSGFTNNGTTAGTQVGSGTSLSAPHVAGAAALLLSAYPSLSVDDLDAALSYGATSGPATDGVDDMFGFGMTKVRDALDVVLNGSSRFDTILAATVSAKMARPTNVRITRTTANTTLNWDAPPLPTGVVVKYIVNHNNSFLAEITTSTSLLLTDPASVLGSYEVIAVDVATLVAQSDPTVAVLGNGNQTAAVTYDRVDGFDLVGYSNAFGSANAAYDLDASGTVDAADLTILKAQMGAK